MSIINSASFVAGAIVLSIVGIFVFRRLPHRPKQRYFIARWKELQAFCKDKATWGKALMEADKLLNKALKKRHYQGKSMGERMVSAQRSFTQNDAVWAAHNLVKKISAHPQAKLRSTDVKKALVGFRQALRDIGALPDGTSTD